MKYFSKNIISAYYECKCWFYAKYKGRFNMSYEDYDNAILKSRKYLLKIVLDKLK